MIGESTRLGKARSCRACGAVMENGDPDACLGWLEGVLEACCGHGRPDSAYVVYNNGTTLTGAAALQAMGQPTWRPRRSWRKPWTKT